MFVHAKHVTYSNKATSETTTQKQTMKLHFSESQQLNVEANKRYTTGTACLTVNVEGLGGQVIVST